MSRDAIPMEAFLYRCCSTGRSSWWLTAPSSPGKQETWQGSSFRPCARSHDGEGLASMEGSGAKVNHRPHPRGRAAGDLQTQCRTPRPKAGRLKKECQVRKARLESVDGGSQERPSGPAPLL